MYNTLSKVIMNIINNLTLICNCASYVKAVHIYITSNNSLVYCVHIKYKYYIMST